MHIRGRIHLRNVINSYLSSNLMIFRIISRKTKRKHNNNNCNCNIENKMASKILPFDEKMLHATISLRQVNQISEELSNRSTVTDINEAIWALKALTLTDLTTLAGDDTPGSVERLCYKAAYPFPMRLLQDKMERNVYENIHTAAVCVYPARVADAYQTLKYLDYLHKIPITAVATGFPSGQNDLKIRLEEITYSVNAGAQEIDVVINRHLALTNQWHLLYEEVCKMREVCGENVCMKTILAVGELGTMENVYKASMVCMMAGTDFIKTSTGKEAVNATIPIGLIMIWAIEEFNRKTGREIGLKVAGGVRTVKEAIKWMTLVKETLGNTWLNRCRFRFGASGLLEDIERVVYSILLNKATD